MSTLPRQPIVAVMGHIDHGKSTLLDTIRKANTVDAEAGGITQHVSAYEAEHGGQKITFLDTPGHAAFSAIRSRGAEIADVCVLVVAATDGVMEQTKEAYKAIQAAGTPCIVAINKIDAPNADLMKTKTSLSENEIMIEEWGGQLPHVEVSALKGDGIDALLDAILLVTEVEELTYDPEALASGFILESSLEAKRGIAATLLIKDGTLKSSQAVVASQALSPVRIMENWRGDTIKAAVAGTAVSLVGWNELPPAGVTFSAFNKKKEAEKAAAAANGAESTIANTVAPGENVIPVTLKADTAGSLEALMQELNKIDQSLIEIRVIKGSIGAVTKEDIQFAAGNERSVVIGFNTPVEKVATEHAERQGVTVGSFTIIYELIRWLEEQIHGKREKVEIVEERGQAKVLKLFGVKKDRQIIGLRVTDGKIADGYKVTIMRRDNEIGEGKIKELRLFKDVVETVQKDNEVGCQIESKHIIAAGDVLVATEKVIK